MINSSATERRSRFSSFDFQFSTVKAEQGWFTRLIDFLLGPASTPHPIYVVSAAAGFSEETTKAQPSFKSARPYVGDQSDSAHFALAASGLGSYSADQEHAGGNG